MKAENLKTEASRITPDPVVLVHGFAGHRWLWRRFSKRLKQDGFDPRPWGYRSVWSRIEAFANRLGHALREFDRFHLVAHSMGAVVVRTLFATDPQALDGCKRIVMLCPPNRGSHAATRVSSLLPPISPSLLQITDRSSSFVNSLPIDIADHFEVGVVIALGDLVVSPGATSLPGIRDSCSVPGMHSAVFIQSEAIEKTITFLRAGSFTNYDDRPRSFLSPATEIIREEKFGR